VPRRHSKQEKSAQAQGIDNKFCRQLNAPLNFGLTIRKQIMLLKLKAQCAQKVDFTCFIRRFLVGMLETCWRSIVDLYATFVTCWLFDKFFPYLLVSYRKLIVYTSMFCIFAQRHYNVSYRYCLCIGNICGSLKNYKWFNCHIDYTLKMYLYLLSTVHKFTTPIQYELPVLFMYW